MSVCVLQNQSILIAFLVINRRDKCHYPFGTKENEDKKDKWTSVTVRIRSLDLHFLLMFLSIYKLAFL